MPASAVATPARSSGDASSITATAAARSCSARGEVAVSGSTLTRGAGVRRRDQHTEVGEPVDNLHQVGRLILGAGARGEDDGLVTGVAQGAGDGPASTRCGETSTTTSGRSPRARTSGRERTAASTAAGETVLATQWPASRPEPATTPRPSTVDTNGVAESCTDSAEPVAELVGDGLRTRPVGRVGDLDGNDGES